MNGTQKRLARGRCIKGEWFCRWVGRNVHQTYGRQNRKDVRG
jgi:hypothetical protein